MIDPSNGKIVNLVGYGDPGLTISRTRIRDWLLGLTTLCNMEIIDGPRVKLVTPRKVDPGGPSATLLWAESGVLLGKGARVDSYPEWNGRLEATIHSCKDFDLKAVEAWTRAHFRARDLELFDHSEDLR
jgi:hypothetical protein